MSKIQIDNIAEGWFNLIFGDEEVKKRAKKRALICKDCSHYSTFLFHHCNICKCHIGAKTSSFKLDNKCPEGLW